MAAPCHASSQIASGHLGDLARGAEHGEPIQLIVRKADAAHAVEDGDGGRHGTRVPHDLLHLSGSLNIGWVRHAVADDGRLESDHRAAGVECGGDVRVHAHRER
eukprot:jgi/Chrpa1/12693/Chrysochromulina_OHIO_Genome00003198-RA